MMKTTFAWTGFRCSSWGLALTLVFVAACSSQEDSTSALSSSPADLPEDDDALLVMRGGISGAPADAVVVDAFVVASRYSEVRFEVPGEVLDVNVRIGDNVRRGQVLATLDTSSRQERLQETRRRYADAMSTVPTSRKSRESGPPPSYLQAELRARQRSVEGATRMERSDLRRLRQVLADGDEKDAALVAQDIASMRNPKPRMAATRRDNKERLARALADELAQRKRQLEFAIEESTIYCPLAGVVAGVYVAPGDDWNTRNVSPAFEILDPTSLVAEAVVPSGMASRLEHGDRAWVQLPQPMEGGAGEVVETSVESISARDIPVAAGADVVQVRQVIVRMPRRLPRRLEPGDEVRVALQP